MYADDLIILATSMEDLQKSLDSLGEYCAKWKLDVNHNKNQMHDVLQRHSKRKNTISQ